MTRPKLNVLRTCGDCSHAVRFDPTYIGCGWGPRRTRRTCQHPTDPQKYADFDSQPPRTCPLRKQPEVMKPAEYEEEPFWLSSDTPDRAPYHDVVEDGDTFTIEKRDPGDYPNDDRDALDRFGFDEPPH